MIADQKGARDEESVDGRRSLPEEEGNYVNVNELLHKPPAKNRNQKYQT